MEAYRVGVSLVLESNVAAGVTAAAEQFKRLDSIIKGTQASVNELAAGMRGVGRAGADAASQWRNAAAAMEQAANAAMRASASMKEASAAGFAAGGAGAGGAAGPGPGAPAAIGYSGRSNGAALAPWALAAVTGGPPRGPGGPGGGGPGGGGEQLRLTGPGRPEEPDARFMSGEKYTLDPRSPRRHGAGIGSAAELAIPAYVGGEFLKSIFAAGFEKNAITAGLLNQGFTKEQVSKAEAKSIEVQRSGALGSSEIGNLSLISKIM